MWWKKIQPNLQEVLSWQGDFQALALCYSALYMWLQAIQPKEPGMLWRDSLLKIYEEVLP